MIRYVTLAVLLAVGGCTFSNGYAGGHPGGFYCQGKGTVGFYGAGTVTAVFGGNEVNGGQITADCSPTGFVFMQGPPDQIEKLKQQVAPQPTQ